MLREKQGIVVVPVILCALIVIVAVLAFAVFQTNKQLQALVAGRAEGRTQKAQGGDPVGDGAAVRENAASDPRNRPWPFEPALGGKPWRPFQEMAEMHRRIDALFNEAFGRFGRFPGIVDAGQGFELTPRMDLVDEGDQYVVRLDVPGAERSEINVSLEDQTLTVDAVIRRQEKCAQDSVLRQERRIGRFRREILLPGPVQSESLDTQYEDGVLTVTVAKMS